MHTFSTREEIWSQKKKQSGVLWFQARGRDLILHFFSQFINQNFEYQIVANGADEGEEEQPWGLPRRSQMSTVSSFWSSSPTSSSTRGWRFKSARRAGSNQPPILLLLLHRRWIISLCFPFGSQVQCALSHPVCDRVGEQGRQALQLRPGLLPGRIISLPTICPYYLLVNRLVLWQRGHQNSLEMISVFFATLLVAGLQFPIAAAGIGAFYTVARWFYFKGYSTGVPENRHKIGYLFSAFDRCALSVKKFQFLFPFWRGLSFLAIWGLIILTAATGISLIVRDLLWCCFWFLGGAMSMWCLFCSFFCHPMVSKFDAVRFHSLLWIPFTMCAVKRLQEQISLI